MSIIDKHNSADERPAAAAARRTSDERRSTRRDAVFIDALSRDVGAQVHEFTSLKYTTCRTVIA